MFSPLKPVRGDYDMVVSPHLDDDDAVETEARHEVAEQLPLFG